MRKAEPALAIGVAEGRDAVISFEARRCIYARFCAPGLPGVFRASGVEP